MGITSLLLTRTLHVLMLSTAMLPFVVFCSPTVYRCTEGGRTVFSDSPCVGSVPGAGGSSPRPTASTAVVPPVMTGGGDYASLVGDWRGQTQYQATSNGQRVEAAHSVVPLVLSIGTDGKVIGISSGNGCKFLGVASPGFTPTMLNLDVSLSGCSFTGMNRRYSGALVLNSQAKAVQLSLQAYSSPLVVPASYYDIKSTLRR